MATEPELHQAPESRWTRSRRDHPISRWCEYGPILWRYWVPDSPVHGWYRSVGHAPAEVVRRSPPPGESNLAWMRPVERNCGRWSQPRDWSVLPEWDLPPRIRTSSAWSEFDRRLFPKWTADSVWDNCCRKTLALVPARDKYRSQSLYETGIVLYWRSKSGFGPGDQLQRVCEGARRDYPGRKWQPASRIHFAKTLAAVTSESLELSPSPVRSKIMQIAELAFFSRVSLDQFPRCSLKQF